MKPLTLIAGLVGASLLLTVAGVLGALFATAWSGGGEVLPPAGDAARLEAELGELRTQVARLSDEVRSLRQVPLPPRELPGATAEPGAADASAPAPADDPALEERVREMLEKQQEAQQEAMGSRMSAMFAAREKSLISRLTEENGLTPYQEEELGKILAKRREAMGAFFRTMFSRGDEVGADQMEEVRKKALEIRSETDEEIKALLTPEQYEAFSQQDAGGRGPGWMGGGGRGGRR